MLKIAFAADYDSAFMSGLAAELRSEMSSRGHEILPACRPEEIPPDVDIVFNITGAASPRANYLRARASNFICTLAETAAPSADVKREAYTVLVKTMSNLLAYAVHRPGTATSYLVTPELGFREIPHGPRHARRIAEQVLVTADVRFVMDNELVEDLPPELHGGDAVTQAMARVGGKLDRVGLLPSVLPLEEILSERERRLLQKLFGVKQFSYGNISARRDRASFWMSGRGVNKADLRVVGRDILLVTGFDEERLRMRVSVPPGADPASRVSVDAVEHFKIYREFPRVGAIIHVHGWLPGIDSTLQSYPCGSLELANEVLELVRRAPDPDNAVVGLRNHGVTATGPDLDTIFERIGSCLERQVPMV